ncbi:hypothetical protein DRJ22_00540 [Candidatus Woesearchaeota archaeon]|nr:MAG: hypothetical protein B6U93_00195 [Candidatus Woesearchaeota archaeon ex4484_78]RLE46980.1 MAG: hypothetical protein DRJ22_00540 [Candidatus Woesearchaeota archaeon]
MDRREIEIILLGIVAILAIVGLVLMFNSKMSEKTEVTGQATMVSPDAACAQTPMCRWGVPRIAISQYLDPEGYLHVTCGCPSTPSVEDIVVAIKVR